jgi:hypothetical protein
MGNNIKINELRIGNLILINDYYDKSATGKIISITKIDSERFHNENKGVISGYSIDDEYKDINGYWLKNIEPIPLTEEWFEKLSEEEFEFVGFGTRIIYQSIKYPAIKYEYSNDSVVLFFNDEMINIIEYVHRWQNIHFALTKEELTMK